MKRYAYMAALVIAASISCGCGRKQAGDIAAQEQVCGGYSNPQQLSQEESEMFYALVKDEKTEFTPLSVSRQVVNGTNYKFLCTFRDPEGNSGSCFVIIYKPLNGEPEIKGLELADK